MDGIETIEIRDTADHFSTVTDARTLGKALVKLTNTHDQAVTVTLQGATFEDPTFTDPVDLGEGQAVAAGTTEFVSTSEPFSFLRVKAIASTAPVSGALTLTWDFKPGDAARIITRSGVTYSDLGLADDVALTSFIGDLNNQASEMVADYTGRDFQQHGTPETPAAEKIDGNGREKIRLAGSPIISVSSVTLGDKELVEDTGFAVLARSGILERIDYGVWTRGKRNVEVEYIYGYATPPPSVVGVVEDLVVGALTHAVRNRAAKGAASLSMDGYSVSYTDLSRQMVFTVEQMTVLDRYRVVGGV